MDLCLDMLDLAVTMMEVGLMFTTFALPSSWGVVVTDKGISPFFIGVFGITETVDENRPDIMSQEIEFTTQDGHLLVMPRHNRTNHLEDVLVYAILVASGVYSSMNEKGDVSDPHRHNFKRTKWLAVRKGLIANGVKPYDCDLIKTWLFDFGGELTPAIVRHYFHQIAAIQKHDQRDCYSLEPEPDLPFNKRYLAHPDCQARAAIVGYTSLWGRLVALEEYRATSMFRVP